MVQIPQYQAQQGLETPGVPRVARDNGAAEGLTRVGSAAMVAGNQLDNTASYLRAKDAEMAAYLRNKEQNKARFDAQVNLDKLNEELNQDLIEAERTAPADGAGLYDGFVGKSLNPKTQAFLSSIPDPEVRAEYEKRMEAFREQWDNNGVNKQYDLGNKYSVAQIGDMAETRMRGVAENPANAESYIKEMDGIIDSAPNLTAPQREEMKRQLRKRAPAIVAESLAITDAEALHYASGGGTNDERIKFLARRLLPAITKAESGGDPNAVSSAGAVGLMQVMPDTGEEIARKLGDKAYLNMSRAEREAFLKNPENNVRYGTTYLEMMLERYKGDAEAALIAYNAGPLNGDRWLKAGRDYSVLPKRSETEPYVKRVMSNLGGAQLASGEASGSTDAGPDGSRSGFVSSVFADMPADQLIETQVKASTTSAAEKARLKMEQDALKVETSRLAADDIASLSASGKGVVTPENRDAFEANILQTQGVDGLAKYREDRIVAETVFNATKDAGRMSNEDLAAMAAALAKPISGENASLRQRIADGTRKGVEAVIAERKDDPATAAVKYFPEVAAAWENANDTASMQVAFAATSLAQEKMGVPGDKINPIPADKAQGIADRVRDETLPAEDRIATLVQAVSATGDPAQQEQIVRQFVRAGLSPKVANVVEAWKRGDVGATRRLFQAAMLTPETAPKLGVNDNTLSADVEDAMLGAGTVGAEFYGLDLGDPRMAEVAASDLDLAKSAVRLAMAGGMSQEAAIQQAKDDIFGPVEPVAANLDNGGSARGVIDKGVDQGALLRGFDAANTKMVDAVKAHVSRLHGGAPKDIAPEWRAILAATYANETNRILSEGVWRNNGPGWSLYDEKMRGFVGDANGKPIVFSTEQLLDMGGTAVPLPAPLSEPPAMGVLPLAPEPGDSGMGAPPPTPRKQGQLKIPAAPDTSLVGGLKAQSKALAANGPLKDGSLQRVLPASVQLSGAS